MLFVDISFNALFGTFTNTVFFDPKTRKKRLLHKEENKKHFILCKINFYNYTKFFKDSYIFCRSCHFFIWFYVFSLLTSRLYHQLKKICQDSKSSYLFFEFFLIGIFSFYFSLFFSIKTLKMFVHNEILIKGMRTFFWTFIPLIPDLFFLRKLRCKKHWIAVAFLKKYSVNVS